MTELYFWIVGIIVFGLSLLIVEEVCFGEKRK